VEALAEFNKQLVPVDALDSLMEDFFLFEDYFSYK